MKSVVEKNSVVDERHREQMVSEKGSNIVTKKAERSRRDQEKYIQKKNREMQSGES